MPLTIRSKNTLKNASRFALLSGIACATLYLGACDITGDSYKNGPVKLPSSKNDKMVDEVSRMEGPKTAPQARNVPTQTSSNLNPKNLFGRNLRSDGDRLDRLERAMQDLRNEFDNVQPSIKRLMAIEADIQNLVGELQRLSDEPSSSFGATQGKRNMTPAQIPDVMNAKPVITPKSAAPKKAMSRKTPPPISGGPAVYDVRVGEHPGKTRLVLDTNAKTSFSIDIDNNEKIMVVDLPGAKWTAAQSKNLGSKTFGSYRVETSDTGSLLILQLKKNAEVISQSEIPGTGGAGRRIVIDLR